MQEAHQIGRKMLGMYMKLPNYVNNWRRLGFTEDDFTDGGSDRLVDALIIHGTTDSIIARLREHLDAGAGQAFEAIAEPGSVGREHLVVVAPPVREPETVTRA